MLETTPYKIGTTSEDLLKELEDIENFYLSVGEYQVESIADAIDTFSSESAEFMYISEPFEEKTMAFLEPYCYDVLQNGYEEDDDFKLSPKTEARIASELIGIVKNFPVCEKTLNDFENICSELSFDYEQKHNTSHPR